MPVFTEEQARQIRDYSPVLGDRPPGIDLPTLLETANTELETRLDALELVVDVDDPEGQILVAQVTILAAAVATLNATPVEVIPAPAAGYYIDVLDAHWWLDFESAAYDAAASGDTLNLKYTNGSGAAVVDPVAGDVIGGASADYHTIQRAVLELVPVAAAAVVAHIATGEWYGAAGDSPLKVEVRYRVRSLTW